MSQQTVQQAVLAGIGLDRTGIIDEVSHFLLERGVDVVETQLCNLRGTASFLLLVEGQPAAVELARGQLGQLSSLARMTIDLLSAKPLEETAPMIGFPYRLISRGQDQAGVVNRLSHLLRVLNVNIENFKIDAATAASDSAPTALHSGFELNLLLSVPRETPVKMLRGYLEQLCGEIGITCDLKCA